MDLAFVIPAYNEELLIGDCLKSVVREVERAGVNVEIIVVDNASTDKTAEIAGSFAGVKVVFEGKKGLVHARHAGFEASSAELVANIDADTQLPEGWITTVLTTFKNRSDLVALSGPYVYHDMAWYNRALVRGFYYLAYVLYLLNRFVFRVGSMIQGGNFVLKRSAWNKVGGFDRSIAFYGEDTDVAMRLHKVGPVKWTFKLPMYTSGRRLEGEGVFKTAGTYTLNYLWVTFFGKPYTKNYSDVRPQ